MNTDCLPDGDDRKQDRKNDAEILLLDDEPLLLRVLALALNACEPSWGGFTLMSQVSGDSRNRQIHGQEFRTDS